MSIEQLWIFITLTFLVSASPGPIMLSCMVDAGRFGFKKSINTMMGASVGNLVLVLLSAIGLGLLVKEAAWFFHAIKWIGAAYLIYLGARLFTAPPKVWQLDATGIQGSHLFWKSFGVAVTNPKGLIYFGALFPQFIRLESPIAFQFGVLTLIFLAFDLVWMAVYALGGTALMRWLTSPRYQQWFNRTSGAALMAAGIALTTAQF